MKLYVDVHDERWNSLNLNWQKIANACVGANYKNAEASVILTNDAEIHEFNKKYRDIDRPTNVLSFELEDDILMGDIFISFDTVAREAKQANIPLENHATHMLVHGMFHLMGYDHITDDEAMLMELKEIKVLKRLGIKNPYADDEMMNCADGSCCPGGKLVSLFKRFSVTENGVGQFALYALFGALAAFGFAPFYQWWWTIIGVSGAYWLTVRNNNMGGFWQTWLRVAPFGAMYAICNFWWVLHSIYVVPELTQQFAIWTVPGIFGLAIAGALIFSWPFVAIRAVRMNSGARPILFACVWTLVLWAREWVFTGFPWNPIANISMVVPVVANSMALWGALGLGFIIVGIIAAWVEVVRNRKCRQCWWTLVSFFVALGVGAGYGYKNIARAGIGLNNSNTVIRVVQPAQQQTQKATHNREQALEYAEQNLRTLVSLAKRPGTPDVIIFPETSYPFIVVENDTVDIAKIIGKPIVFGANSFDGARLFNSLIVADKTGEIQRIYSKSHLVPFGEYKPLGILPAPVDLAAGSGPEVIAIDDLVFVPAICYEVVFSDSLLPKKSGAINAIVNVTNDNWFGKTPGTYQHLDMVRRYAIESGLPIVRANYSGISAFIASDGEIISALPIGVSGVLDGFVWGAHQTPYRFIGLNGVMILILIVSITGIFILKKRS